MEKLNRGNIETLESYAEYRDTFRAEIMAHKQRRRVPLGEHATLYFEDFGTMKYQVQEMLRAEKIFEPDAIEEEIAAYNPLIPDGSNWKATFMVEYPEPEVRRERLKHLVGIEDTVWVRIDGHGKVYPYADEDLERDTEEKTSSVHFLRFELTPAMIGDVKKAGTALSMGIDHPGMPCEITVEETTRETLAADLDAPR